MTKTTIAIEDFPQQVWERVFPDPNAVYIFDNIHSPNMPHWTMVDPADLPIVDPEGNYKLDVGPGNPVMHKALIDLGDEVRRILPTTRIKIAPRLYLPSASGEMELAKASAVTEFDTRPERQGWYAVPTLLLSSNQSVEDAFREAYRFLWMLLEEEIPFLHAIPANAMEEIEKLSFARTDPIVYDWLSKFPKLPGESKADFDIRTAKERRALVFQNMAMSAKAGFWDDDRSPSAEMRRSLPDMMMRWAIRGTLGKVIEDEYGPIQEEGTQQVIPESVLESIDGSSPKNRHIDPAIVRDIMDNLDLDTIDDLIGGRGKRKRRTVH